MNRIIKFRAWDGKEMNTDICLDNSDGMVFQFLAAIPVKTIERPDWKLMQFTGLTDKNGKEIYEGDVVATCWHEAGEFHDCPAVQNPYVVEWDGYKYTLKPTVDGRKWNDRVRALEDLFVENTTNEQIEVIGNIYENPELLASLKQTV